MKKTVFIFLQFLLFLFVFFAGSLWNPLRLQWFITHPTPTATRYFAPEGLLLMVALYIAILVIELLRKRVLAAGIPTTIAFVFALVLGWIAKFGFVTHDIF
jgi:hypothetical protein